MTECVEFGTFRLEPGSRQLLNGDVPVRLTPKAFELLCLLVKRRPQAVSKAELADAVWPGLFVADEGLPRLVNEIRIALGDTSRPSVWVRTIHGFGYAFAGKIPDERTQPDRYMVTYMKSDIPLGDGQHLVGRDPAAAVRLEGSVVSRQHARIIIAGQSATIEDLDSKNGTYIGETRLTGPRELRSGDVIRIGDVTFAFRSIGATPTQTLPR
jgi:DNA-binding winged helix-turn-helix (wHTH) protein